MTDNPLWDVIQGLLDDPKHRYPPKVADLARETGVSEQVFSKWKKKPTLPEADLLLAVSQGTGLKYELLLVAALEGKSYLPRGSAISFPRDFQRWLEDTERGLPLFSVPPPEGSDDDVPVAARRSRRYPPRGPRG